jgi:GNAT superfamily N-acetyltransferase
MVLLKIAPYRPEDNVAALALEEKCVQGRNLVLKYRRPTFHARSEVYSKWNMLCAKVDGRLVGTAAWAEKEVSLHNRRIKAAYMYDLRVHPDYRKKGVSFQLTRALFDDIGGQADCLYTWIAGENDRCLLPARRLFGMKTVIPFTYAVFPIYRKKKIPADFTFSNAETTRRAYLDRSSPVELVPDFGAGRYPGYVTSIVLKTGKAGCSVWTNENLLEEQVVSVPRRYRLGRALTTPLRPFFDLPWIPKPNDTIPSWFLFDFSAADLNGAIALLTVVNNMAYEKGRKTMYLLLQNNSPLLAAIRKLNFWMFAFPYCFLAKGTAVPDSSETVYVDIRDL